MKISLEEALIKAMHKFRLINGAGSGKTTACVMSAAGWLHGQHTGMVNNWNDQPLTVCPTLRSFYIHLNDTIRSNEQRELLWPHAKKALYTETENRQIEHHRGVILNKGQKKFLNDYIDATVKGDVAASDRAISEYLEVFDAAIAVGSCHALAVRRRNKE